MQFAVVLGLALAGVCFPHPIVSFLVPLIALAFAFTARADWPLQNWVLAVLLSLLPALLSLTQRVSPAPLPQELDLDPFSQDGDWRQYLTEEHLTRIFRVLDSRNPRLGNPEAANLLSDLDLPPHASLTLFNLNQQPVTWTGNWFSDTYREVLPNRPELVWRDGRLYFVFLAPLPNESAPRGFLCLELLFHSNHESERGAGWLGNAYPVYRDYGTVLTERHRSVFLAELSLSLGLPEPPFELRFIPELHQSVLLDTAAFLGAFLFLGGFIFLRRDLTAGQVLVSYLIYLAILAFPRTESLDSLTTFASYVFGNGHLGGLLSSPFHFFLTVSLVMLTLQTLCHYLPRIAIVSHVLFVLVLFLALFVPGYLQSANSFSFVHPLDAFLSPGTCLEFLAFLLLFAFMIILFNSVPAVHLIYKLPTLGIALPIAVLLFPQQWPAAVTMALIWVLRDFQLPVTLKAGLIVLVFYPNLVRQEQQEEVTYIRNQVLDEITLLVERNYFRMGRIIQRLPELETDLCETAHPHMMEMFARRCGLFQDEIDFALRLTRPGGTQISEISRQISLQEGIPLGAENRISTAGPEWLTFRRTITTPFGDYHFLAVLGNDFHNLSLIRNLRFLENQRGVKPMPYLAYIVDVFQHDATPLYNQRTPNPLTAEDRENITQTPWFWRVEGRNTVFFFRDRNYIYRITHKATPLKMIFIRYLALFLVIFLMVKVISLAQRPGRGLLARWNRSFGVKLAGFIFVSSVLPTSLLGYFLLTSIRGNQERAQQDMARTQILAVKNLLRDLIMTDDRGFSSRDLRLQKYARLLGEDLTLYEHGSMVRTSQPEVFREGLMYRRLPYELARRLILERAAYHHEPSDTGLAITYTPFELDNNRQGVLAMTMIPFSRTQNIRWLERIEFTITLLLGLMFLMGLLARVLARYFLEPVSAITRRASRVARGKQYQPIPLDRQDELQQMVDAFNTMQERIQAGQMKLEQQLQLLDETLKSMSSGLLGLDEEGRVILQNARALELLKRQVVPDSLATLVEEIEDAHPLETAFQHGQDAEAGWSVMDQGEQHDVMARLIMVPSTRAGDLHAIVALEDITDALAANRFKAWSEMARRVAHEIKNPLTPIQLELDHVLRLYHDDHPDFGQALEEAVTEIREQVTHLKKTATEFGDYARPVELEKTPTDLDALLNGILDPYRKTLTDLKIETFLDSGDLIFADERLLRRSLHNLVVNAIQAMEESGTLRVRSFRDEDWVNIWLEDTGPGIPEEEKHRVFEAYFSTKDQGTGLGLVIARRYVVLHGGHLKIDSSYTGGTRFIIQLPADGLKNP
ncbi:MAG: ATP-binding protein [Acidobacteriota bacterium]|nr:ATP-binding protein [Acidobacteriota bacterium]